MPSRSVLRHWRAVARRSGDALVLAGALLAGLCLLLEARAYTAQAGAATYDRARASSASNRRGEGVHPYAASTGSGTGRIVIPELSLAAPITDGVGAMDLMRGVGHVPGTAAAGGLGTMGLAGHRDTFFRRLRGVRVGMKIYVTGSDGTYVYQVDRVEIVGPSRIDVLGLQRVPRLVLVTCYPFSYLGPAPRRFVVFARLTSAAAATDRGNGS